LQEPEFHPSGLGGDGEDAEPDPLMDDVVEAVGRVGSWSASFGYREAGGREQQQQGGEQDSGEQHPVPGQRPAEVASQFADAVKG
jgi:hypothetical protein